MVKGSVGESFIMVAHKEDHMVAHKEDHMIMTRKRMTKLTPQQVMNQAYKYAKMGDGSEVATIGLHRLLSVVKMKRVNGKNRSKGWTPAIKRRLKRFIGKGLFIVSFKERHRFRAKIARTWREADEDQYCKWVSSMTGIRQRPSKLYYIDKKLSHKQTPFYYKPIEQQLQELDDEMRIRFKGVYYDKDAEKKEKKNESSFTWLHPDASEEEQERVRKKNREFMRNRKFTPRYVGQSNQPNTWTS